MVKQGNKMKGVGINMGYKFYKFSVNTEDPECELLISNLSAITGAARNLLIRKLLLDYFKGESNKENQRENKFDEIISKLDDLRMTVSPADKIEKSIINLSEEIFRMQKSFETDSKTISELLRKIIYELPQEVETCKEATFGENVETCDQLLEDSNETCDDSYIPDWIRPGYGNAGYRPDGYKRPDGIVIYPRGWNEARPHDRRENWQLEPEYIIKKYYE